MVEFIWRIAPVDDMTAGIIRCSPIYPKIKSRRKFKSNFGGFLRFWAISQAEDAETADGRSLIVWQFCDGQTDKTRLYAILGNDQIMR